jgi:hypothetical protein
MYDPDDRLDSHNPNVHEAVAAAGLCANTDLRTGRTCILPLHHRGSCEFTEKLIAEQLTWVNRYPTGRIPATSRPGARPR